MENGSQVTPFSYDFCKENGIQIQPISQIVNKEGTGDDTVDYLGYIEARLSQCIGKKLFEVDALLLVFPNTEYHRRMPVATSKYLRLQPGFTILKASLLCYKNQEESASTAAAEGYCENY